MKYLLLLLLAALPLMADEVAEFRMLTSLSEISAASKALESTEAKREARTKLELLKQPIPQELIDIEPHEIKVVTPLLVTAEFIMPSILDSDTVDVETLEAGAVIVNTTEPDTVDVDVPDVDITVTESIGLDVVETEITEVDVVESDMVGVDVTGVDVADVDVVESISVAIDVWEYQRRYMMLGDNIRMIPMRGTVLDVLRKSLENDSDFLRYRDTLDTVIYRRDILREDEKDDI